MNVSPRTRDIVFDFRDSCNCCRKDPPRLAQVYVNRRGVAEIFDEEKARGNTDLAVRHAVENMMNIISVVSEQHGADAHEVIERLHREHQIDLRQAAPVTVGTIHRVNSALVEILSTPTTPSAGSEPSVSAHPLDSRQ